jgi:DNA polymerase-1
MKRIVLLDTHAIIHRAYHALPDFRSSDGTPTGALYGLCNMVSSIIRELKPDYIFACYDLPGKTFRHDAYEDYKGTRKKGDDDLITQLISSREVIESLSIPIYDAPGYEADDVIGTISKQFGKKDVYDVIIASGDMDTLQLIEDKHIRVFTLKKGITDTVLLDEKAIVDRFGFEPIYIQDYKALRGDVSDNIPGVPGVGEKTATILIQKFKTIENLYKVLKKDESKVKEAGVTDRIIKILKENEDGAIFSKMLASIRIDAPVKVTLPEKHWNESFNKEKAEECFKKYEFRTMMSRFDPNYVKPEKPTTDKKSKAKKSEDGEVGEVKKTTTKSKGGVDLFSEPIDETRFEEAKLMVFLLNSEKTNPDLETILTFADTETFDEAYTELVKRLKKEPKLLWLYENMDRPLIDIVSLMKKRGMKMDREYLNILSTNIRNELFVLEEDITKIAGEKFNLNSPKQLSQLLFERLALPTKGLKKRKDGLYSTDVDTLNKFIDVHPIISKMLEYRELEKLRSTYIDAWIELLDSNDELHPTFILTGAATGRFASQNPGVQNIPVRGARGKELRRAFIARPGYTLVAFDYSQIELRALAILSQDPSLIEVFREGHDIHAEVASRVYGLPPEEITKDMRRHAKVINFGVLYGMGSTALAKEMGVPRNEAKDFIDKYFSQFPKIAVYLDNVLSSARKLGYTETLFGRRRYIPNIKSNIPFLRAMAERMAGNAPIQGTATADIIRNALVNVYKMFDKNGYKDKAYAILQIHDELVFEIEDSVLRDACEDIKETMEMPIDKMFIKSMETVPILTEKHIGKNWGDMV